MIDLSQYPKIQRDIEQRTTSLSPLIVINEEINPIYISTTRELFDGDKFFEDYNLKINSISEKVDLKGRVFQINNLSFSLSNYKKGDTRISDLATSDGWVNKEVKVYYKTQSCIDISDCILMYKGKIRRLKQSEKSVNFELEDLTQSYLSKEVPIANINNSSQAYNKDYLQRPIPITYGKVDRAPAVPIVNKVNIDDPVNIRIICDDLLNSDRDIQISGFNTTDQEFVSPIINDNINPLYIYKGDYFQVLERYNSDVLGDDSEDWSWAEPEQYDSSSGNMVEVTKHYSGTMPLNPPAYNELQCVKVRFPNQCLVLGNPEGDSIEDDVGVSIIHQLISIKNPELAIDNPISFPVSSFYNLDYQQSDSLFDSRAQIPDNTIDINQDELIVSDFRIHQNAGENKGIWLPKLSRATYPHHIFEWLNINMHNFNGGDQTHRVVYKQLPTVGLIKQKLNFSLECLFNSSTLNSQFPLWQQHSNNNYLSSSEARFNSYQSIFPDDYKTDYHQDGADAVDYIEWSHVENATKSYNHQWWYDLNDNSPVPQGVFMRFRVSSAYRLPVSEGGVGCDYVFVCLDNGSFNVSALESKTVSSGNSAGQSRFWSLFNVDSSGNTIPDWQYGAGWFSAQFLFKEEDYAEYAPISVTQKGYVGQWENTYFTSYRCYWNGISQGSNIGSGGANIPDDGYWGSYGFDHINARSRCDEYLSSSDTSWVIWIKGDAFGNVGLQYEDQEVNPMTEGDDGHTAHGLNEKLMMTTNTMFPTLHKNKGYQHDPVWGYVKPDFYGFLENPNVESFQISDYDLDDNVSDRRVSLVLPMEDMDISDEIRSDTFFHGKVVCNFLTENNETTNSSDARFKLNIGVMDTSFQDSTGELTLDFDSLDDGFDADENIISSLLIDKSLSDCHSLNSQMWSSNPSDAPSINEENSSFDEQGENAGLVRIAQLWQTNNYNSLNLIYRLDNNNNGNETVDASNGAQAVLNSDIHSVGVVHFVQFEAAFDSELYLNVIGRADTGNALTQDEDGNATFRYTGEIYTDGAVSDITAPSDIIFHFIEQELQMHNVVDLKNMQETRLAVHSGEDFGLSINKEISAKQFIEGFANNTRLIPRFNAKSEFSFSYIKDSYSVSDVAATIKVSDIQKYSFNRTPVEEIKTIVNVKYKIDYKEDDFMKETGYVDGYDMFGNGDGTDTLEGIENGYKYEYLGLGREDSVLEFEAKYIRDEQAAIALRDFIYLNNCNQHNIFSLRLPIKYISLEAGDIINFDSLIGESKAFGEDYTEATTRNGQLIYPYFIITSINKKLKGINIECHQLHSLNRVFYPAIGSTTRLMSQNDVGFRNFEDYILLENYLLEGERYYTREQKRVSDILQDGAIDNDDLVALYDMTGSFMSQVAGDTNFDGVVNVVDIIQIVNTIIGEGEIDPMLLSAMDMNNDGIINVIDIVAMVNQILGEG